MVASSSRRALLVAVVVCLAVPASASASARHNRTEAGIVRAMNYVRTSHRLPPLAASALLARAADQHSAAMLHSNRFGHGAFAQRVRHYVHSRLVGENLAWMRRCSAAAVVRLWLNSAAHRRIMLTPGFRRVGVARRASSRICFVTADFAS